MVPNLVLAQRVIDKMAAASKRYVQDETGEAMIGLIIPGENTNGVPTLYVLDTIAPDESAVRGDFVFEQGDELQAELIYWYHQNWEAQREKRRTQGETSALQRKWDVPLKHLGDWHRQPGHMIAPSGGDLMTARHMLADPERGLDFLLAPIVTLDHPNTITGGEGQVNFLTVPDDADSFIRIDFWYIDRKSGIFMPITPIIYPNDQLPRLVEAPWHLIHDDRFRTEMAQLRGESLFASVINWDVDGDLPLEVCIACARAGWDKMLVIATPWNYPAGAPAAYQIPFVRLGDDEVFYDLFSRVWAQREKVADPPGWQWTADRYLVDYIRALQTALGLKAADPVPAAITSAAPTPTAVDPAPADQPPRAVGIDDPPASPEPPG
jgi:hypothetical protein